MPLAEKPKTPLARFGLAAFARVLLLTAAVAGVVFAVVAVGMQLSPHTRETLLVGVVASALTLVVYHAGARSQRRRAGDDGEPAPPPPPIFAEWMGDPEKVERWLRSGAAQDPAATTPPPENGPPEEPKRAPSNFTF